jgi:hypothetical protein
MFVQIKLTTGTRLVMKNGEWPPRRWSRSPNGSFTGCEKLGAADAATMERRDE